MEQRGSTSLGIAGQNEIDIYVPVLPNIFYAKTLVPELTKKYGPPKSIHKTRIRFKFVDGGKKEEYETLKHVCNGLSAIRT